jgi:hypothetical protein
VDRPSPSPEQIEFLADLVRESRASPERYARGSALLERQFSFEAIIERRIAKQQLDLKEAQAANLEAIRRGQVNAVRSTRRELRAKGVPQAEINIVARREADALKDGRIPILAVYEKEAKRTRADIEGKHGRFTFPRDESLSWALKRRWMMTREEAEAVCLVAVFFYETEPETNPALPPTFQGIPWGDPHSAPTDPEVFRGRWLYLLGEGLNPRLFEVAGWALSRLRSDSSQSSLPSPSAAEPEQPIQEEHSAIKPSMSEAESLRRSKMNDTARAILGALEQARVQGVGLQLKDLARAAKRGNDAVFRALKYLKDQQYDVSNEHNRAGYFLVSYPRD